MSRAPAWNGTPWSFSGTAAAPGRAPIACGYFVSTALEHAGLAVERRRLAQQAAEHIVAAAHALVEATVRA